MMSNYESSHFCAEMLKSQMMDGRGYYIPNRTSKIAYVALNLLINDIQVP
jgi:hypothetical protein